MNLYDNHSREKAERIEQVLRIVWGEVAPRTYAEMPTYGDMPTYAEMEKAFGSQENWPKRNYPTELPAEPKFGPTVGPLPAKDWNAAIHPPASSLPPKDWNKPADVLVSPLPPKDWGNINKPKGPSSGP